MLATESAVPGRAAVVAPVPSGDARSVVRRARRARARRARRVCLVTAGLLLSVGGASVCLGDVDVALGDVVPAALGRGDPGAVYVVRELRLPRAVTGALVGAAFGFSGAILQRLARNPLASPDVIGISTGAALAAVVVIVVVAGSSAVVSLGALAGALLAALAVYLLAWRRGVMPYRLVLVGIGVSALLASFTAYLLTTADIYDAQRAAVWLSGSLNSQGWDQARPVGVALVALAPVVLVLARPLGGLQLGDDAARGIGIRVPQAQMALLGVAVALAAMATASAGPIEFVALAAPSIARRVTRTNLALVSSALIGALLVVVADLVGRRAFAPVELPVGVVTGILGAPYLLWLLARPSRTGRAG